MIANYMAQHTELKEVWLVVSPHNPLKSKKDLIDVYDRLEMARLATEDVPYLKVSDIELKLPQPSYTVDTLTYLAEKHPGKKFALIMGSDNLSSLHKWKNYEVILERYPIFVYPRPENMDSPLLQHPSVQLTQTPLIELSATFIRKAVADKKAIDFWVPEKVKVFIEGKGLYSK